MEATSSIEVTKLCTSCNSEKPQRKFIAGGRVAKCLDCIVEASHRERAVREERKRSRLGKSGGKSRKRAVKK